MKPKRKAKFIIVTKLNQIAVAELNSKKQVRNWFKQQNIYHIDDLMILSGKIRTAYLPLF